MVFTIIQGGLYFHARNVAQSAAREGVSYLRLAGNSPDPGSYLGEAEKLTRGYATELGRLRSSNAVGTIDVETGRVTMTVTGVVILPLGGEVEVSQSSAATLEQFRGDIREGQGSGTGGGGE